ncbi:hypothetical protein CLV92_108180 [Kineococcus xinjiangensis]|uniref:DUF7711 domain-containing protein n=1 Tax=Kineococcus xinjiangensis TaxID=512762 RepID=A0A2S6IJ82_9ACTN|nr:hypothetical protein [Kineococcus xinjiangensis]PPK94277.1 hypothetical protein CLV92_108180 [Kineococcus xinjiangensis]
MRSARALTHLESLARTCQDMAGRPASIFPLQVRQLWVAGPLLEGSPAEVEDPPVALCVDVEPDATAWRCTPAGAQHWANAARLPQAPVQPYWRSVHAPVWNHVLHRPALLWDAEDGVAEEVLQALREGRGEDVRLPDPGAERLGARLEEELAVSLRALRAATGAYRARRWAPGKLEPAADAQHAAAAGYLDVLDALAPLT